MRAEIKDRWLQALRSGNYPKGSDVLRDVIGYSALGVLCDLYLKEVAKDWHGPHYSDIYNKAIYRIRGYTSIVSYDILLWAELSADFEQGLKYIDDKSSNFEPALAYIKMRWSDEPAGISTEDS